MRTSLLACTIAACAAALAQPAPAITFPTLTTIYVGSGVIDTGEVGPPAGLVTIFHCSNVSGVTATIRLLVLDDDGTFRAQQTLTRDHGASFVVATRSNSTVLADVNLTPGNMSRGVVNIESTESGVFCNATVLDAADTADGFPLPLVRVNPHPGTEE